MESGIYYKKEDVEKFLQEKGIFFQYGDLKEYWTPVLHINQIYMTGPGNILPTIYFNGMELNNAMKPAY